MKLFSRSKRRRLMYGYIILWIAGGIYAVERGIDLLSLTAYFTQLTVFSGSYIWGETVRSSLKDNV